MPEVSKTRKLDFITNFIDSSLSSKPSRNLQVHKDFQI